MGNLCRNPDPALELGEQLENRGAETQADILLQTGRNTGPGVFYRQGEFSLARAGLCLQADALALTMVKGIAQQFGDDGTQPGAVDTHPEIPVRCQADRAGALPAKIPDTTGQKGTDPDHLAVFPGLVPVDTAVVDDPVDEAEQVLALVMDEADVVLLCLPGFEELADPEDTVQRGA